MDLLPHGLPGGLFQASQQTISFVLFGVPVGEIIVPHELPKALVRMELERSWRLTQGVVSHRIVISQPLPWGALWVP